MLGPYGISWVPMAPRSDDREPMSRSLSMNRCVMLMLCVFTMCRQRVLRRAVVSFESMQDVRRCSRGFVIVIRKFMPLAVKISTNICWCSGMREGGTGGTTAGRWEVVRPWKACGS